MKHCFVIYTNDTKRRTSHVIKNPERTVPITTALTFLLLNKSPLKRKYITKSGNDQNIG